MQPAPLSFSRISLCNRPAYFTAVPGWQWRTIIPDYYNLWVALRGQGTMEVDGQPYPIGPSTAFVLAPGQSIQARYAPDDPAHNLAVHFRTHAVNGQRMVAREWPLLGVKVRNAELLASVARHLIHLGHNKATHNVEPAIAWVLALLTQILQDACQPPLDPMDQRLLEMAERIQAEPGQRVTVAALAREAGLSRVHFTRRFTQLTGMTPSRYMIRSRIDRAAQMIEHSSLKMSVIAEALGYLDVYFFSRQFKAVKGFSPRRLRPRS